MSLKELSGAERDQLTVLISDLKKLFEKNEIDVSETDELISELGSSEAKSFIKNLLSGTKPETALREAFFAGQSLLSRYLASEMIPEVNTGVGFVDYKMVVGNRFILLELKPLFDTVTRDSKSGKEVIKLKQKKLEWKNHLEQIIKYIKQGGEYIVITDLKDWYFFDDTITPKKCTPFFQTNFLDLEKDFATTENIYNLIERYKYQSIREELDQSFFNDLKDWIDKLREIEFEVEEEKKIEIALGIINKFIFIQTLSDHGIIEFRWLIQRWKSTEELWGNRNWEVLNQFFEDTIRWFFKSYDTELFTKNEINYLKKDSQNIKKFYNAFKKILGLTYLESDIGGQRGILQYNFKFIDEDIFGRAYEEYLANVRHEEGIYYTPSYITQFITEKTVATRIDNVVKKIIDALEKEDFEKSKEHLKEFIKIKVIDPSCGSGSFLVKAFRVIWKRYKQLQNKINELIKEIDVYDTLTRDSKTELKASNLQELKLILGFESNRDLISKLLLRHIHGNDLDYRAISIAKVNLWLEAIKQSPKDFVYEKLPTDTNRILPYLDMNIVNGDALVDLPVDIVINYLQNKHKNELLEMSNLRKKYHDDPTKEDLVSKVVELKDSLRQKLLSEFSAYLKEKKIESEFSNSTKPIFWPLEFWYAYFDETKQLGENEAGFDCLIGNPPYERIQVINSKTSPEYGEFLKNSGFNAATGNYDLAVIFIERGFKLLKKNGQFGYIVTNKFVQGDYGIGIRKLLSKTHAVKEIVDFGDQQVFKKKATTYTCLLFLQNEETSNFKYTLVKRLEDSYEQLQEIENQSSLDDNKLSIFDVDASNLNEKPWMFASSSEEEILKKFKSMDTLEMISDAFVGLQTSADPVYIVPGNDVDTNLEITSKKLDKKYLVEKEIFKPILTGRDVKRWEVNWRNYWLFFPYLIKNNKSELIPEEKMKKNYPKTWQYLIDHKKFLDEREKGTWVNRKNWHAYVYEKNLTEFSKPKIMTGVLANRSSFTLDKEGKYYFVGGGNAGVYGVAINDSEISSEYLVGLLNSSLLDWRLRKKTSKFHGGYFSYAKRFIDPLPIVKPTKKNSEFIKKIENDVNDIISKVNEVKEIEQLWEKWSNQMKDTDRTLLSILETEEQNIRESEKDHLWFDDLMFLISKGSDALSEKFENFEMRSGDNSVLEIIGYTVSDKKTVFQMKCKEPLLADHLYLCIKKSLDSKTNLDTLKKVFEKTSIPIMQPNPSNKTKNIMTKIYDEFETKFGSKTPGIVETEKMILEKESDIDAVVFKLYDLELNELNLVLSSLSTSDFYNVMVEKKFRDIT